MERYAGEGAPTANHYAGEGDMTTTDLGIMALVEDTVPNDPDTFDKNGASGFAGGNGGDGGSAGLVWLLGTATLEAKPGSGGVGGAGVDVSTYLDHGAKRQFGLRWYFVGGGGMGGGRRRGRARSGGI